MGLKEEKEAMPPLSVCWCSFLKAWPQHQREQEEVFHMRKHSSPVFWMRVHRADCAVLLCSLSRLLVTCSQSPCVTGPWENHLVWPTARRGCSVCFTLRCVPALSFLPLPLCLLSLPLSLSLSLCLSVSVWLRSARPHDYRNAVCGFQLSQH